MAAPKMDSEVADRVLEGSMQGDSSQPTIWCVACLRRSLARHASRLQTNRTPKSKNSVSIGHLFLAVTLCESSAGLSLHFGFLNMSRLPIRVLVDGQIMESFELNNGHILLRIHRCRYFRIEGLRFQGFRNVSSSWVRQIAMGHQHHEEGEAGSQRSDTTPRQPGQTQP